jgi:DNA invertase Pin-like site-specific DNA recombinase
MTGPWRRWERLTTELVDALELKGVALRILNFGGDAVDTRSATGRLTLNMFAPMAQFEREIMLERQREGIAKAKAEGKYKGRKPTARAKAEIAVRLFREGKPSRTSRRSWGSGGGACIARCKARATCRPTLGREARSPKVSFAPCCYCDL